MQTIARPFAVWWRGDPLVWFARCLLPCLFPIAGIDAPPLFPPAQGVEWFEKKLGDPSGVWWLLSIHTRLSSSYLPSAMLCKLFRQQLYLQRWLLLSSIILFHWCISTPFCLLFSSVWLINADRRTCAGVSACQMKDVLLSNVSVICNVFYEKYTLYKQTSRIHKDILATPKFWPLTSLAFSVHT